MMQAYWALPWQTPLAFAPGAIHCFLMVFPEQKWLGYVYFGIGIVSLPE